ncbi:MAG: GNAT family N-acetyltransferase, partial [Planctomycetota bacterium]
MSKDMPAEQQLVVDVIAQALQRKPGEAVVLELENLSVIPEHQQRALNRDVRRAEQAVPDALRDFFSKRIAVTRFLSDQFSGGKLQLAAMSMDKVLANVFQLQERQGKAGTAEELTPYEVDPRSGQLTENGWRSFAEDLKAYTANQANGYRGGGKEIHRPENALNELRIAIPEQNPSYRPRILPDRVEQYINTIMGLKLPKTPRETKGVPPGNLKGQVLREAQGERVLEPADIQRRGKTFKRAPERTIQEVNPLRQELNRRGVDTTKLLDVTERLNVDRLRNVTPRFELEFNLPATDVIRAGFQPGRLAELTAERPAVTSPREEARTERGREVLAREGLEMRVNSSDAVPGDRFWEVTAHDAAGNRVARVEINELGEGRAEVGAFDVVKEYRRRGIGEALFREAADRAKALGVEELTGMIVSPEAIRSRERILPQTEFSDALGGRLTSEQAQQALREGEIGVEGTADIRGMQFLPKAVEEIAALTPKDFAERARRMEGGITGEAVRIGREVSSPEDLARLQSFRDQAQVESKEAMSSGDFENAMVAATKAQFFREAYETATKTGSMGHAIETGRIAAQPTLIERDTGGQFRVPEEAIKKTVEEIRQVRREGVRGFTDPAKFGVPEELKRQDRERATGQKEFDLSAKEAAEYVK